LSCASSSITLSAPAAHAPLVASAVMIAIDAAIRRVALIAVCIVSFLA
jgi:hypothetical protein